MDHPDQSSQILNANGATLLQRLRAIRIKASNSHASRRINVPGVGSMVSAAYEQLRNATEYTQEHLLRQRAIRRFYIRNLSFGNHKKLGSSLADELVIELTQAGYVANNTLPVSVTERLAAVISKHYGNFWRMREAGLTYDYAHDLTLDLLSVESDTIIASDEQESAFTLFAFSHYLSVLPKEQFIKTEGGDQESFEANLYIAIHKSLRKSDQATIRFDMQRLQQLSDKDIHAYVKYFTTIDGVYFSDSNDRLTRHITRYGAPLRVLKSLIDDIGNAEEELPFKDRFMAAYRAQVGRLYEEARKRLNKGVVKSIIFLLITKAIIGIAIEIPYDLLVTGSIVILPLAINLLTPLVYMTLLRAGLKLPGDANTEAIMLYAENMLYGQGSRELYATPKQRRYNSGFTVAYVLMFVIVFGLTVGQLIALEFNIVHGTIFFVFLATASFLGFRLSNIVRELELVSSRPGVLSALRDFFYMPFILLGQWLSDKYARINIVALILDTLIELPLKTILRLIRQWTDFLNEKRDAI